MNMEKTEYYILKDYPIQQIELYVRYNQKEYSLIGTEELVDNIHSKYNNKVGGMTVVPERIYSDERNEYDEYRDIVFNYEQGASTININRNIIKREDITSFFYKEKTFNNQIKHFILK